MKRNRLSKRIFKRHRSGKSIPESDADIGETRIVQLRHSVDPLKTILRAGILHREIAPEIIVSEKNGRRA